MPVLSSLEATKTKRILVYGPPKSGKTQLVGSLAEFMNLEWFDLENGKETLFKLPKEWQARINMHSIPDSRVMPMAIESCLKIIKGGPVTLCIEHGKVACPICKQQGKPVDDVHLDGHIGKQDHCVVFDSATQLTYSTIANLTKNKPDDYKLLRDDWGNLSTIMNMFFSQVQAARYNLVFISHEVPIETNEGKEKLVPGAGSGNFSRSFAKYFDDVIYCTIENKKHKFASATTYANNIMTGSRSGVRLEDSKEPKLYDMFKTLEESKPPVAVDVAVTK